MFLAWRFACLTAILVVACGYGSAATAQQSPASYPAKPVRIVMPLGPGNSLEIPLRMVAENLTSALGQPFVIEAQPGAAGQIGTERVARSAADGYTLLAANDGIITMLPNLQKQVRYDPVRDFSPIAQMVGIPFALIVHPSVQAKSAGKNSSAWPGAARQARIFIGRPWQRSAARDGAFHERHGCGSSTFHTKARPRPPWRSSRARSRWPSRASRSPSRSSSRAGYVRWVSPPITVFPFSPRRRRSPSREYRSLLRRGADCSRRRARPPDVIRRLDQTRERHSVPPTSRQERRSSAYKIYGNSPEQFAEVVKTDLAKIASLVKRQGLNLE